MSDPRVHPTSTDAPPPPPSSSSSNPSGENPTPPNPIPSKPVPPPATYVVQFPKEQILRYPPPENARKYQSLTRRKTRRSCCRRCCCYTLCLLIFLIIAAAVTAVVMYLVFRFKAPKYTVTRLDVKNFNITTAAPVSTGFNLSVRADNPNTKVGIYYLAGSAVSVSYDDVMLSNGVLPVFYQPKRNVTVIKTELTGNDVVLGGDVRGKLRSGESQGRVPLTVRVKAPVKIKVGSVNTWRINVKVKCDVVVDGLSERARIVSNDCGYSVRLW